MKQKRIGISLKYKLLLLLTAIPVVSLTVYITIATRLFENDKIAYVKDSSVAVARSLAIQFRVEVNSFLETIKPVVESYDLTEQKFSDVSSSLFAKQDRIDGLVLIKKQENGRYSTIGFLNKPNDFAKTFLASESLIVALRDETLKHGLHVTAAPFSDMHLLIANVLGDINDANHVVVIALYRSNELTSAFTKANIYQHFLIDKKGEIKIGPKNAKIDKNVIDKFMKNTLPEGAIDVLGENAQIASYSDTGVAGMKVTAIVSRSEALAAVTALLVQSLLFFIGLISSTIIISVIASVKLTSALSELYEATRKIAKGQFDVRVQSRTNDEVGGLADGFNFMAAEVSRLMVETADKARMAGELATVKIVQETLFPPETMSFGRFKIVGHFEPASECGGDWWNYSISGDNLYLWIGDATGHGAPAAMVTSAAKSASSIIEDLPNMSPTKILEILNKAIHETSKGRILMTFFVACIDMKSGKMTYANASHEPPYIIRKNKNGQKFTKNDLVPLLDSRGPRLGDKRASKFTEGSFQLEQGDAILFYTDGIVDLKNRAGVAWGERQFLKSICDSATQLTAEEKITSLKSRISTYREQTELVDDITLLMCQYGESA